MSNLTKEHTTTHVHVYDFSLFLSHSYAYCRAVTHKSRFRSYLATRVYAIRRIAF